MGKGKRCWICGAWHYLDNLARICANCLECLSKKPRRSRAHAERQGTAHVRP